MELRRFRLPALWILSVLSGILLIHLIGVYIYEDGGAVGVRGGSINIGLVGEAPEVPNPLTYGQNKQRDLILSFLFRGLLGYNDALGNYEGDIATCDIADLSEVSCILKPNGLWSDGTKIQTDDIIATLQSFKANPPSEKMKVFLSSVIIVSPSAGTIKLSSKEKNSLMLDLLTYPIVRSDMLERIRTGRLSKEGYITSGSYTFLEKEKNTEYGYDRITIGKSEKNPGIGWLDKYNFLFFPNTSSLERSADNIGIIIPPPGQEKILLGPRFAPYEYALYEYIGFFINTDTIAPEIRQYIILQMQASLKGKVVPTERPIERLFGTSSGTVGIKIEKNLADVLRAKGYIKPDERQSMLEKDTGMLTGSSVVYASTRFIDLPGRKDTYFIEEADGTFLIPGKVPAGVSTVSINDYTLKEFRSGNNRFSYKVSLEDGTLKEGKNTYILTFDSGSIDAKPADVLTLYYERDGEKLKTVREGVENEYLAKLNTGTLLADRMTKISSKKEKVQKLDQRYYYNDALEVFRIRLTYIREPSSLASYAEAVSNALTTLGIKVEGTPIEAKGLSEMLKNGTKNYDAIIVGFEATGRFSRIGQIFLSTEAKNGINFAKIESKILDGLFANLRISYTEEKTREIQAKIQEFIEGSAFFFPISSPLHTLYIDKNLKGIKQISTFQDITSLHKMIAEASIKDQYMLKLDGKGFSGFFSWLFGKL